MRAKRLALILAFAGLASAVPAGALRSQDNFYRLGVKQLICIIKNADRYLAASDDDEIFVSVSTCPDIPENPLLDALTNELPDIPFSREDATDSLLIVSREEFKCLSKLKVNPDKRIYNYYFEGKCHLEAVD